MFGGRSESHHCGYEVILRTTFKAMQIRGLCQCLAGCAITRLVVTLCHIGSRYLHECIVVSSTLVGSAGIPDHISGPSGDCFRTGQCPQNKLQATGRVVLSISCPSLALLRPVKAWTVGAAGELSRAAACARMRPDRVR